MPKRFIPKSVRDAPAGRPCVCHFGGITGKRYKWSAGDDANTPAFGEEKACRDVAIPSVSTRSAEHHNPSGWIERLHQPRGSLPGGLH